MSYPVHVAERAVSVDIVGRRPDLRVAIEGQTHSVSEQESVAGEFAIHIDGELCRGFRYSSGDQVHVRIDGRTCVIDLPRDHSGGSNADSGHDDLRADMPGVVVSLHCEPGQAVNIGDKLVTLESMKLQISLVAHRDGVIERVHILPNTSFERGALLVSLAKAVPA